MIYVLVGMAVLIWVLSLALGYHWGVSNRESLVRVNEEDKKMYRWIQDYLDRNDH